MNRFIVSLVLIFTFAGLLSLPVVSAQEAPSLDWDIDSVFDVPPAEPPKEEQNEKAVSALDLVKQRGVVFESAFQFIGGVAPGWDNAPWYTGEERNFSLAPSAKMLADFTLDVQISEVFRVNTSIGFEVPLFIFKLKTFFADYNLLDRIFIRAGKYDLYWGISSNYAFTNLLARLPENYAAHDSFILKADIPVGIGGFQLLAMTRADLLNGAEPGRGDIGYGGKFNLALRMADFDLGIFNQDDMPLRFFLSVKTTLGGFELYNEWLGAVDVSDPKDFSGAVNIGFTRSFFKDKLWINGEVFYNAEKNAFWYEPESTLRDAEISPFLTGFNFALNLLYRFGGKLNPNIFIKALYSPDEKSSQLVPGLRLSLFPHTELYLAVPMALGSRDGYYYTSTPDLNDRPFSIVILLSLKGSFRLGYNF